MPPQPQDNIPIHLKFKQYQAAGVGLASIAARCIIVFERKEVGYRLLSPGVLGGVALFLYGLEAIGNFHIAIPLAGRLGSTRITESLSNFALLFVATGLWQRRERWKQLLEGKRWHTRSFGVSRLEFLPIRKDLIYRYVDPAVAVITGMCLRRLGFSGLGLWIMFCGLCLHIVEQYRHGRQLEADLDMLDSQIESEVAAETAAHFEGESKPARSLRDTAGIPTGADDGLEAVIARRKNAAGVR